MKLCKTVTLHFENGEVRETLISKKITNEEIEHMGVNEYFDIGRDGKKDKQKCIKVEIN